MILEDYYERIGPLVNGDKFLRLYSNEPTYIKYIFAHFHQQFNEYFEFVRTKQRINGHLNAEPSRSLIKLIEEYEELKMALETEGNIISLNKSYQNSIDALKGFLQESLGSTIPDNFQIYSIEKYEPILFSSVSSIKLSNRSQLARLILVGEGAYSIVYKFVDPNYDKTFAIKKARKDSTPRELERFKIEYDTLKRLRFPYILEVYNFNQAENSYMMEYCDTTLFKHISQNNIDMSFYNRKKLALQFLYGLNYLHAEKILHRDISYKNILIKQYDYKASIIKLSDFGLVKQQTSNFTDSNSGIKGTIIDPSLEKFKDYTIFNEIYSIGFILNFIFTGKQNLTSTASPLNSIVHKCIDKDSSKRYQSVSEILLDLEVLEDPLT